MDGRTDRWMDGQMDGQADNSDFIECSLGLGSNKGKKKKWEKKGEK